MLIPSEELRHLVDGPREVEMAGGVGLVEVAVTTSGDSSDLLCRCREVLRAVLEVAGSGWPPQDVWARRLPDWFVQGCAGEVSAEQDAEWLAWWRGLDGEARARAARERPWSLADWLHWLQPEERQWYWWDGVRQGPHKVLVLVEVPGWPVPLGALEWLLRVAGAEAVSVAETLVR